MNTAHYKIPAGRELRIECSKNDPIKVTVDGGGRIVRCSWITVESR